MKTKKHLLLFLTIGLIVNCSCGNNDEKPTVVNNSIYTIINSDTFENKNEQSNAANIIGNAVGSVVEEIIEMKEKKNEKLKENKISMWVYLISPEINSKEIAAEEYAKLKDISGIYIFKKSNDEFYIIKDDGYTTEEQLMDSIGITKKRIAEITQNHVYPLNLSSKCSLKTQPTLSRRIKYNHKKIECYTCD